MGWLKASKQFNVPQATLRRRFHNTNKIAKGIVKHLGRPSCLSSMVEKKLTKTEVLKLVRRRLMFYYHTIFYLFLLCH